LKLSKQVYGFDTMSVRYFQDVRLSWRIRPLSEKRLTPPDASYWMAK